MRFSAFLGVRAILIGQAIRFRAMVRVVRGVGVRVRVRIRAGAPIETRAKASA